MIISSNYFNELKARVKAECLRRCYKGSVAEYGSANYDYTFTPSNNQASLKEHYEKLAIPINAINSNFQNSYPLSKIIIDESSIKEIETKLKSYEAVTNIEVDGTSATGCNSSCTGLCHTGCWNSCDDGCTNNCSASCGSCGGCGGCGSSCGGCSDDCHGSCSGGCTGSCVGYCKGTCTGGCTDSCTGECGDACTGGCGNCTGQCWEGCGSSCTMTGGSSPY